MGIVLFTRVTVHRVHIKTDFSYLVDMIVNLIDWPAFAFELASFSLLRTGFLEFSIVCIPRTRNVHAESRQEGEKQQCSFFSYR